MASESSTPASPFDSCAHCGSPFEMEIRYPVATEEGLDGTLRLYSFCDAECKAAWRDSDD